MLFGSKHFMKANMFKIKSDLCTNISEVSLLEAPGANEETFLNLSTINNLDTG